MGIKERYLFYNLSPDANGYYSSVYLMQVLGEFIDERDLNAFAIDGDRTTFAEAISKKTVYTKDYILELIDFYDNNYFKINSIENTEGGYLIYELYEKIRKQDTDVLGWLIDIVEKIPENTTSPTGSNEDIVIIDDNDDVWVIPGGWFNW